MAVLAPQLPRVLRLVQVLLLVRPAAATTQTNVSSMGVGCIIEGWAYNDTLSSSPIYVDSAGECQDACAQTPNCSTFSYWLVGNACWLNRYGITATMYEVSPSYGMTLSGPRVCPEHPSTCSEEANPIFPASTRQESMAAWVAGYQPQKLQCYPRADGEYASCRHHTKVLDDAGDGWLGTCGGMLQVRVDYGQSCEERCLDDATCPGYQESVGGGCWLGVGLNCSTPFDWNETLRPVKAKRFQRGLVQVIMALPKGSQIMGLQNIFGTADMIAQGSVSNSIESCRRACYAVLGCEYWQLNIETGCYAELPEVERVQYPLLNDANGLQFNTPLAKHFVAGEYIRRLCPENGSAYVLQETKLAYPGATMAVSPEEMAHSQEEAEAQDSGFPLWGLLLVTAAFLGCCIITLISYVLLKHKCASRSSFKDALGQRQAINVARRSESRSESGSTVGGGHRYATGSAGGHGATGHMPRSLVPVQPSPSGVSSDSLTSMSQLLLAPYPAMPVQAVSRPLPYNQAVSGASSHLSQGIRNGYSVQAPSIAGGYQDYAALPFAPAPRPL